MMQRHTLCRLWSVAIWYAVWFAVSVRGFAMDGFEVFGTAEQTGAGGIRLTHDNFNEAGGLFALSDLGKTWEFQLLVNAHGRKNAGGTGFAFWYSQDQPHLGPLYGGPDHFFGFALIISTAEVAPPGVEADDEPNDVNDETKSWVAGFLHGGGPFDWDELRFGRSRRNSCSSVFRNHVLNDRGPTLFRIRYNGHDLSVRISEPQDTAFRDCFTLHDVDLPPNFYYGVTAMTSETRADIHDVYALEALPVVEGTGALDVGEPATTPGSLGSESGANSPGTNTNNDSKDNNNNLEFLVSQTDVVVALAAQHREFAQRLHEVELAHERELQVAQAHLDAMLAKLTIAERQTQDALASLERLVDQQMAEFTAEHRAYRYVWMWPFAALTVLLVAGAMIGYNRYRHLLKHHLL